MAILLNNKLDKNFHNMLLPLNVLESIYCQPKFKIARIFVTPNGIRGNLHCLLGVVIVVLINIVNTFLTYTNFIHGNAISEILFRICSIDAVFYSVSAFVVCASNILQSERNVELILKLQNAYRVLHDENDTGLKKFQKYNLIFVTTIILTYFLYNLTYVLLDIYETPHLVYNMVLFYFDVNVIVAFRIVKFIDFELSMWKKELNRFAITCSETNHERLLRYLVNVGIEEKKLFKAYLDIIGAFKLCRSIYGMSILVLVFEGFAHPLIYVQYTIDVIKISRDGLDSSFVSKLIFFVSLVWIVKTVTLLSCLCVACQQFYLTVAEVEVACAAIQAKEGCLVYAHRLSKNVCRLGACVGAKKPLRAGNVLSIDATMPLQLLTIFGTYTIVLLQFAFL